MSQLRAVEVLNRIVAEVIPEPAFATILAAKSPQVIKFGADPSAPDLHLGHAVVLRVLRHLQVLGHRVQFLIGDYTAMIGDPTGKSETRPILTRDQVLANAETYQKQVFTLLIPEQTDVVFNSTWLDRLSSRDLVALAGKYTVARMMERDDFTKRFYGNGAIGIHEFLYPLLQGYDSVALKADIEIGGTDQKFNLLMGRHLQKEWGLPPQTVVMTPIIEGLDGVNKMSKSLGNHIGILDTPTDMFGKIMSIPDTLIIRYFNLLTDLSNSEILEIQLGMDGGANPKQYKLRLGETIVAGFYGEDAGRQARCDFELIFSSGHVPNDMPDLPIVAGQRLSDALVLAQAVASKKEYMRLVGQGAVSVDGVTISDGFALMPTVAGSVIRVGKRRFYRTA